MNSTSYREPHPRHGRCGAIAVPRAGRARYEHDFAARLATNSLNDEFNKRLHDIENTLTERRANR
ncbi:MAG: hypothetical protein QM744_19640 [Mesorhizobium sp.]